MNYLIVENGIVENIIIAEEDFANSIGAVPCYDGAEIGKPYKPPAPPPTTEEKLRADVDYLAMVQGVTLDV